MVSVNNIIKITDLGLGLKHDSVATQESGAGTANYMSPESLRQPDSIGVQSDIYSLGISMYELISGQLPYEGVDRKKVYQAILKSSPRALKEVSGDINQELNDCIMSLMAKDPNARPNSWEATSELLQRALDHSHVNHRSEQKSYIYNWLLI